MTVSGRGPLALPLAILGTLAGSAAHATADGPDRFRIRDVRADDTLTLRAQPNAGARKIAALPPNTRGIENLGCVDGKTGREAGDTGPATGLLWCKVRIGSLTGWASARFLGEDHEVLKPYSVSGAPTAPGQFTATSTAIERTAKGEGRWRVVTQTVVSGSTTTDVANEVMIHAELVDCRRGRAEVIRLGGDDPGYAISVTEDQDRGVNPPLSDFDEYNLWWLACWNVQQRYRWR